MSPFDVERREHPADPVPKPREDEGGPRRPDVESPDRDSLLKRMRKVDPKQAERYRQRTGE
ncbi:MAG: ubiquitin-like protein UBact [Nitrospiria bacterium]